MSDNQEQQNDEASLATLDPATATADELIAEVRKAGEGVPSAMRELVARLDAAEAALETANEENGELRAKLENVEAARVKAEKAAKAHKAAQPAKARKVPTGLRFEGTAGDERELKLQLLDAIGAADKVEVLFCANGREVLGVPPYQVAGDAWQPRLQGLMLTIPIDIAGPQPGKDPFAIDGFALLLDDKPAAYAPRGGGTLHIGVGQRRRIADDIIF